MRTRCARFFWITTLVLAPASLLAEAKKSGAPIPQRDWKAHPAVVQVDTTEDILVLGDTHGDFDRLVPVLSAAKIISGKPTQPSAVSWSAGKAVMVITGDMIDKGKVSLQVIAALRGLQSSAAAQGGHVVITMGNHEAEFLADPAGKKTSEFQAELKAAGMVPADVAACQGDLGAFLCSLPVAARVNDWFFCHGGNTGGLSIGDLEKSVENGYAKDGYAANAFIDDNSILEARLNDKGPAGLPWIYNGNKDTDPKTLLGGYVESLGVKHLVQGHQPGNVKFVDGKERKKGELYQRWGLYFLIDGGMSQGVNDSRGGSLRISGSSNPTAIATCFDGSQTVLWDGKTNQGDGKVRCGKP
jgi:hypothetical protein